MISDPKLIKDITDLYVKEKIKYPLLKPRQNIYAYETKFKTPYGTKIMNQKLETYFRPNSFGFRYFVST